MSIFQLFKKAPPETLTSLPQPLPRRNDPCWCGSDQKYKKCHAQKDRQTLQALKKLEKQQRKKARRSPFG